MKAILSSIFREHLGGSMIYVLSSLIINDNHVF